MEDVRAGDDKGRPRGEGREEGAEGYKAFSFFGQRKLKKLKPIKIVLIVVEFGVRKTQKINTQNGPT